MKGVMMDSRQECGRTGMRTRSTPIERPVSALSEFGLPLAGWTFEMAAPVHWFLPYSGRMRCSWTIDWLSIRLAQVDMQSDTALLERKNRVGRVRLT